MSSLMTADHGTHALMPALTLGHPWSITAATAYKLQKREQRN
jgi:hypothetical protein